MGTLIRKLIMKTAEKVSKVDPADAFTQINVDDVISIIKELIL